MTESDLHFEDLWEQCENLQKDIASQANYDSIINEIIMKLELYRPLNEISEEEKQKAKSRILGEILLSITSLSYKDNINVFEALNTALQYRTIQHFDKKYAL